MDDKKETMLIAIKCIRGEMTNTNEEEQTTPWAQVRSEIGSNDVNTTLSEISYVQYIQSKIR
jgi:hypothetical protein